MALLTAAEGRFYVRGLTGTTEDTDLNTAIARVGEAIGTHLGYPRVSATADPTCESTTYTLYVDGPGGVALWLPVKPITSVTSIYDDPDRVYGSSTLVASGDYETFAEQGLVILTTTSAWGAWSTAWRAIKATVVAGYGTIPVAIKAAAGKQLRHEWRGRDAVGTESIQGPDGSVVKLKPVELLPEVKAEIAGYRLMNGAIG